MGLRSLVYAFVLISLPMTICGQSDNPFELQWRKGTPPGTTANSGTIANVDNRQVVPDTQAVDTGEIQQFADVVPEEVVEQPVASPPIETPEAGEASDIELDALIEELAPQQIPVKRKASTGMLMLLFGLSLVLIAWVVNASRGFLRKVYRAALNINYSSLLMRENKFASAQYLYYVAYVSFFINAGVFLYLATRYSSFFSEHSQVSLIVIMLLVVCIYLCRHSVLTALGWVFPVRDKLVHFSFSIILFNILVGIVLLPVNMLLAFGPESLYGVMIWLGFGTMLLLYLIRQFRGVMIGADIISANPFQFFIYLCAIEILPILVLFKLLHN